MNLISSVDQRKLFLLLFSASLIVFVLLKIPHLSLPFFWDEAGVYGHMAFEYADRHLSLHPNSIDQWVSRGHPLLYPNYIAIALKIFGTNTTVAHTANLVLTILFLITIYYCIAKYFDPVSGCMACILLMAQPLFYTQSIFVLPEITLAFMIWLILWGFIQKNYIVLIVAAAVALFIKETAIIWIVSLLAWNFITENRVFSKTNGALLLPFIPYLIFLGVQKQTFGWYFFPFHTSGFNLAWKNVTEELSFYLGYIFRTEGRWILSLLLLAGTIRWGLTFFRNKDQDKKLLIRFLAIPFTILCVLIFSATTYYTQRYTVPVLPFFCAGCALAILELTNRNKWIALAITVAVTGINIAMNRPVKFNYDNDMYYVQSVVSTKKTIQYLLDHNMLNQNEFYANMPILFSIQDARYGYLPKDTMPRGSVGIGKGTKYAMQTIPGSPLDNPDGYPLDTFIQLRDGAIRTIIYKVMPKDTLQQLPAQDTVKPIQ